MDAHKFVHTKEAPKRNEETPVNAITDLNDYIKNNRAILNAAKNASLILAASCLQERPGDVAEAILTSLEMSRQIVDECLPEMRNLGWARADVFGICSELIAKSIEDGRNVPSVDSVISAFKSVSTSIEDASLQEYYASFSSPPAIRKESDVYSRARLSFLKASLPLLQAIQEFTFWKDRVDPNSVKIMHNELASSLFNLAGRFTREQAANYGISGEHLVYLWQGTISRTFNIACAQYRKLSELAMKEVDAEPAASGRISVRKKWAYSNVAEDVVKSTKDSLEKLHHAVNEIIGNLDNKARANPKP